MEAESLGLTPAPVAATPMPSAGPPRSLARLLWAALWFQESAYDEMRDSPNPLRRGLIITLILSFGSGLLFALGLGFDRLVSPDLNDMRQVVLEGITDMAWYQAITSMPSGEDFERQFLETYNLWWDYLPTLFGAPTWPGVIISLTAVPIVGVICTLGTFALIHVAARALGGQGRFGPTLGALSLANAPVILAVLALWPGVQVGGLTNWWGLAMAYWAVRSAHRLPWQKNLLAIILPYLVLWTLAILIYVVVFMVLIRLAGPIAGPG